MSVIEPPKHIVKSREPIENTDGNAYGLIATVKQGLRREGNSKDDIALFEEQAKAGDYDHLVATCLAWSDDSD